MNQGSSQPIPRALFQTETLPVSERFAVWRESVLPLFDSFREEAQEVFRARVESFNLNTMFFGLSAFSSLRFRREKNHRFDEGADHLLVQLYLAGGYRGYNGSKEVEVTPGDISLLDLGRPLETKAFASNALSLIIPRDLLFSFITPQQLCYGAVIRAATPMGNILASHLLTTWRNLPSASLDDLDTINNAVLGAVIGGFSSGARCLDENDVVMERLTLDAMLDYIRQNLSSESLTPEHLCSRFGCSRARLYRLFAPLGGVAAYIRECRLERCREELTRAGSDNKILEVALRWGFTSHSHFSRTFKQTFGISPTDAVEKARAELVAEKHRDRSRAARPTPEFHHWLRHL